MTFQSLSKQAWMGSILPTVGLRADLSSTISPQYLAGFLLVWISRPKPFPHSDEEKVTGKVTATFSCIILGPIFCREYDPIAMKY